MKNILILVLIVLFASCSSDHQDDNTMQEEPDCPFSLGTASIFEITQNQELIVALAGFDCITISNLVWRFGADVTSGNYTFKDQCPDMIAYNVRFNMDSSFSEMNIKVANGPGFFGQFSL